jgi:cytochrome P450
MRLLQIALEFRLAGPEPVGVTLTYLIWCVLQRPDVQKRVEAEVADVEVSDSAIEKVPNLTAAILETLRLWGVNVRRKEDITEGGTVLGGMYHIPKGTVVSTQAYLLHRNPANWKDPFRYYPHNLLNATTQMTDSDHRWNHKRWRDPSQSHSLSTDRFQPFSAGSRTCAAYHLAMMEIRIMAILFFKLISEQHWLHL